jgi:hypothetical protein
MTRRKIEEVTENTSHSFEDVLDVPSGSTEITKKKVVSEKVDSELYDDKDEELDDDLRAIQDTALEMYEAIAEEMEDSDPSKRARLAEVSGQLLNVSLGALKERASHKKHKDTLDQKDRALDKKSGSSGGVTNNNTFIGSQTELLEFFENAAKKESSDDDPSIIDGECEESDNK